MSSRRRGGSFNAVWGYFAWGAFAVPVLAVPALAFAFLGIDPQFSFISEGDSVADRVAQGEQLASLAPSSRSVARFLSNWEYTTHCLPGGTNTAGCTTCTAAPCNCTCGYTRTQGAGGSATNTTCVPPNPAGQQSLSGVSCAVTTGGCGGCLIGHP